MDPSTLFRRETKTQEVSEAWLLSYADMITLLLAFFVVFVSTSEPKEDQLAAATRGMQARFGTVDLSTPFQGAFRTIQGIIENSEAQQAMSVEKSERGLQIELSTTTYFVPYTAELQLSQIEMLSNTVNALNQGTFKQYEVIIEGHTDDVEPVDNAYYPTNWELSAARASRMVRFFIEQGFEAERLRVIAYGSARPKLPNLDPKGYPIEANRERNKRIVVRMERTW